MSSSERKVRPPIITVEAVADVFNDEEIVKLAKIADLPPGYDLAAFAVGIREAARIYTRHAGTPNAS
jgi:hypothetical protein